MARSNISDNHNGDSSAAPNTSNDDANSTGNSTGDSVKKKNGHRDSFWTEMEGNFKEVEQEEETSTQHNGGNLLTQLVAMYEERR